jgi:pimeloyl-ACP methyl ester carboxylesterase
VDEQGRPVDEEGYGTLRSPGIQVEADDGTLLHVEIDELEEPADQRPSRRRRREKPLTVVFSHGYALSLDSWHYQRKALRGRYRMVFWDQRGHGRSATGPHGGATIDQVGKDLGRVIEATAPEGPLVLVGHSMGGMTIMAFAELYPEFLRERVVGVVLMATSGGRLEEAKFGLPSLIARVGAPLLPLVNNATRVTGGMLDRARQASSDLAWLLTRRYGFGDPRPSPALVSFVEEMNSRTSTETVARYLRTLYSHARYPALVALRNCRTLVIVGDKDMITPLNHSEEIVRHLPGAEFVTVPDSGHVVMLEHAAEVNAAMLDFLVKISK